ncbi:MAG: hypothetical protein KAV82_00045 [Phycisphaerae bacterium]|nr:hypothetical protein [Phycisphaerae bacterium]
MSAWKAFKSHGIRFLTAVVTSMVASAIVAGLTYYYLSENLAAVVNKSLDIIKFDEAVGVLDEVSSYEIEDTVIRPANQANASAETERLRTKLNDANGKIEQVVSELEMLIDAFELLTIDDRPLKLFDDKLVASPRGEFLQRLKWAKNDLSNVPGAIGMTYLEIDRLESVVANFDEAYLKTATQEIQKLVSKVDRARASLVERRDAMLRVLEEFGKDH